MPPGTHGEPVPVEGPEGDRNPMGTAQRDVRFWGGSLPECEVGTGNRRAGLLERSMHRRLPRCLVKDRYRAATRPGAGPRCARPCPVTEAYKFLPLCPVAFP